MTTEGVDYSFARPNPADLAAAGKRFAVRYGGMGSQSKFLTAAELAKLRDAGLDVVANVEGAAGGYRWSGAGRDWAESGEAWFRGLGMPSGRPIYFSVDWDASAADFPAIDAALKASADVIGAARVGVYGSYDVIQHCRAAGTARWLWQTYAWSSGKVAPGIHLYQYRNGVALGGGDVDLTRALTDDYGQWEYDMTFNADDLKTLANTDGVFPAPEGSKNADGTDNTHWAFRSYVTNTYAAATAGRDYAANALTVAKQALTEVRALAGRPAADVDEAALAAALAPLLNGVTEDQIKSALESVRFTTTDG